MSDYRIGISIEHDEDRSYVVREYAGQRQRFEIRSFDMKRKEIDYMYADVLHHFLPNPNWDLYLGLVEVPFVAFAQDRPKRRLSDLGLRRPK